MLVTVKTSDIGFDEKRFVSISKILNVNLRVKLSGASPQKQMKTAEKRRLADVIGSDKDHVLANLEFKVRQAAVVLNGDTGEMHLQAVLSSAGIVAG
jgi:hypothetical protein